MYKEIIDPINTKKITSESFSDRVQCFHHLKYADQNTAAYEAELLGLSSECNNAYDFGDLLIMLPNDLSESCVIKLVNKAIEFIDKGNLDGGNIHEFLSNESPFEKWFDKYEAYLISKLDFTGSGEFNETKKYLTFIEELYNHSNDTSHVFIKRLEGIGKEIKIKASDKNSNYFLSLLGHKTVEEISTPFFNPVTDEYPQESNEESTDSESPGRTPEHTPRLSPFMIAPNVYARFQDKTIFITENKDFQPAARSMQRFNFLADRVFTGYCSHDELIEIFNRGGYRGVDIKDMTANDLSRVMNEIGVSGYVDWTEGHSQENEEGDDGEDWRFTNNYSDEVRISADKELEMAKDIINHRLDVSDLVLQTGKTIEIEDLKDFSSLSAFEIRNLISEELGISLSDLSIKEQYYFLKFAKTVTNENAEKFKRLVRQYGNPAIKTFLSLESGGHEMGNKIIEISKQLEGQPEAAEQLFAKYAEVVDGADNVAREVCKMYEEIFSAKKIDKNAIYQTIFKKGANLLIESGDKLNSESLDVDKRTELINQIVSRLDIQNQAQDDGISELKSIAESLTSLYGGLEEILINNEKIEYYYIPENLRSNKYDSEKVKELIKHFETLMSGVWTNHLMDEAKRLGINDILARDSVTRDRARQIKESLRERKKEIFLPVIDKLKKLNIFQVALEEKLEQIIFGQQSAELPKDFSKSIESGIENYQPELSGDMEPIYMPVGVSRLLPKEGEVSLKPIDALTWLMWMQNQGAKSELTVCDTIQTTNYQALYNLSPEEARAKAQENGNRDKQFYQAAIDTLGLSNIRLGNYQELEQYSGTKDWLDKIQQLATESPVFAKAFGSMIESSVASDAGAEENPNMLELLKEYGQQEIAFIIANPALKISHEKEPRYDVLARVIPIYLEIKKHAEDLGINDDQEALDLSLYLSYYKQDSMAHLRAELFATKESLSRQRQITKSAKDEAEQQASKETAQQLTLKSSALTGQITDAVQKQENKKIVDLLYKNIRQLGLSTAKVDDVIAKNQKLATEIEQKDWYKKIKLTDFYYPQTITSLSFEMNTDQQKEAMSFREQYSSYRGDKTEELAIESNQVVASTNPLAAAKLLVLSQEKQAVYAEKVLRPLLINYYLASSINKEEALNRFRADSENALTISDHIHLIQEKIVRPIENKLSQNSK